MEPFVWNKIERRTMGDIQQVPLLGSGEFQGKPKALLLNYAAEACKKIKQSAEVTENKGVQSYALHFVEG